jgi:predicted DNA-binding protein with PD1-like motif
MSMASQASDPEVTETSLTVDLFMDKSLVSRRRLLISGLAGCSALMTGVALPFSEEPPSGYIRPGAINARGKAPRLKARLLSHQDARTFALIFGKNDEVMTGLTEFAETNHLAASHFTAIGAFQSALLGWFDSEKNAFREVPITSQVEVASFSGDIGLINGKPAVHAHAVVAFPDGTTRGGHVITATVWPTLELFLTDEPVDLVKEEDPETGLYLFDPRA